MLESFPADDRFSFEMKDDGRHLSCELSCEVSLVGRVSEVCRAFIEKQGISQHRDVTLVLRELLTNAIEHGGRGVPGSRVRCSIEHVEEACFKVTVEDEGEGFDYSSLDMSLPEDPRNVETRGYALLNALSERLEFNKEGNRVTAYVSVGDRPEAARDGGACGAARDGGACGGKNETDGESTPSIGGDTG